MQNLSLNFSEKWNQRTLCSPKRSWNYCFKQPETHNSPSSYDKLEELRDSDEVLVIQDSLITTDGQIVLSRVEDLTSQAQSLQQVLKLIYTKTLQM